MSEIAREAAESLWTGLGRRDFVRAVAALSAGAGVAGVASGCSSGGSTSTPSATSSSFTILQPEIGRASCRERV